MSTPERDPLDSGLCCMARHAQAVAPWTCDCPCHRRPRSTSEQIGCGYCGNQGDFRIYRAYSLWFCRFSCVEGYEQSSEAENEVRVQQVIREKSLPPVDKRRYRVHSSE